MGGEIKKSESLIKYFTAALMRDKILMCFLFLCMLAIIAIVVCAILKKRAVVISNVTSGSFETYIPKVSNSTANVTNSL